MQYAYDILIPAWNAEKYIENSINSLLNIDYVNYKIILIAGGNDKTLDIALKFERTNPNIIVIEQKIPHKNKALNLGLKKVKNDIIVLSDIDCAYPRNWLTILNQYFQNDNLNVITGSFLPYDDRKKPLSEYYRILIGSYIVSRNDIVRGVEVWGGMIAFRREVFFNKIGIFNEKARTGTDRTLGIAFNKNSEKIYFTKDIILRTECFTDNKMRYIKKEIRWARNHFYPINRKQIPNIIFTILISIFKIFYPFFLALLFLLNYDIMFIFLFSLPYFSFFIFFLIRHLLLLRKRSELIMKNLNLYFNYKKAFKIIPLLFFIQAYISLVAFLYPKRSKWLEKK